MRIRDPLKRSPGPTWLQFPTLASKILDAGFVRPVAGTPWSFTTGIADLCAVRWWVHMGLAKIEAVHDREIDFDLTPAGVEWATMVIDEHNAVKPAKPVPDLKNYKPGPDNAPAAAPTTVGGLLSNPGKVRHLRSDDPAKKYAPPEGIADVDEPKPETKAGSPVAQTRVTRDQTDRIDVFKNRNEDLTGNREPEDEWR